MPTTTISIRPTRCIFNGGQFDSDHRYIRRTADGPRTTMLAGPSFAVTLNSQYWVMSWRFKCGSYNITGTSTAGADEVPVPPPADVPNVASEVAL